jgi:hypothetical protein
MFATVVLITWVASASAQATSAWTATGFVGSYFGASGDSPQASDISSSTTFGGQVSRHWGYVGAELLADFAPKYHIDSALLNSHPWVNSYMANVMGVWSGRSVEPYVSGGIGGIQMAANVLPFFPGATGNTSVFQTRFGWDIGAGAFGFSGGGWGLRGDVRYFKATTANTLTGTAPDIATEALLSGINFWRANIGVAYRW